MPAKPSRARRVVFSRCVVKGLSVWALVILSAQWSWAQENQIFGGRGINLEREPSSNRTTAFDFSALRPEPEAAEQTETLFKLPKWKMPNLQWPKMSKPAIFNNMKFPNPFQRQTTDDDREAGQGRQVNGNLFSKRDSGQPGLLTKWNEHNKRLWERTKARFPFQLGNRAEAEESDDGHSFDRLTRGFEGSSHRDPPMAQPPLRSSGRRINRRRR